MVARARSHLLRNNGKSQKSTPLMPKPSYRSIYSGVALALLAFAGNSLLARAALRSGAMDAASFTSVRLVSGALMLCALVYLQQKWGQNAASTASDASPSFRLKTLPGDGWSGFSLFAYAALFSYAYLHMSAATGALLLFGAVQTTMIGWGVAQGERMRRLQWTGFVLALAGLTLLMLPGLAAPGLLDSAAMLGAGVAWGAYSLLGKRKLNGNASPTAATAGNFVRAAPIAIAVSVLTIAQAHASTSGVLYAIASGALTSGLGYAIWYRVLPSLQATHAATLQLSVPVLAALGGVLLLGEAATWPLAVSGCAIMAGIGMVIWDKPRQP
jgi:drug/metabolite transporter (DMT)-like permease